MYRTHVLSEYFENFGSISASINEDGFIDLDLEGVTSTLEVKDLKQIVRFLNKVIKEKVIGEDQ